MLLCIRSLGAMGMVTHTVALYLTPVPAALYIRVQWSKNEEVNLLNGTLPY